MNDHEAFPDPIARELPKKKLPGWVWIAAVPMLLAVLFGLAALGFAFVALTELDSSPGHDPFPEPTAADGAAVLSVFDFQSDQALSAAAKLEGLKKTHYENDTLGLDYEHVDSSSYVYSSIDEEEFIEEAEGAYAILLSDLDPDFEPHDELFRWGDVSRFCVYAPDGEPSGYAFVGRRGTRVVWAEWGGLLYEPMTTDELGGFLGPIVERMGSHMLSPPKSPR